MWSVFLSPCLLAQLMLVHLVVIVWCFLLICHQLEGIARNRTTNEQINAPRSVSQHPSIHPSSECPHCLSV